MRLSSSFSLVLFLLGVVIILKVDSEQVKPNYADALSKSILFFEGQRSGKLPSSQRMKWRKDSALRDGQDVGVDLTGGYYDAGDNVKFNFPMAFTTTVLAWSVVEFGNSMGSDELVHVTEAVKWGTDYLLKSTSTKNVVYVMVGDPYSDHSCWQRPEDMDTKRTSFFVSDKNPGSEVSAETAAALAASSIIFKTSNPDYSQQLLERAIQVFDFADKNRGSFNDSLGYWLCPFYCDFSGYQDELLWAAAWLYKASKNQSYWDYVVENVHLLGSSRENDKIGEFGWDDKHAGFFVLLASDLIMKGAPANNTFRTAADAFVCTVLPESSTIDVTYSPGGLMFKKGGSNMQHPTALSFLLLIYARYLNHANYKLVDCDGGKATGSQRLIEIANGQVDYILGDNPMNMSYIVGYGDKFPEKIHHRGSSLPSLEQHPEHLGCKDGTLYFQSNKPNPNELTGAVVGGPLPDDTYPDSRKLFVQSEPTTYINAPLVGLLAYFNSPQDLQ